MSPFAFCAGLKAIVTADRLRVCMDVIRRSRPVDGALSQERAITAQTQGSSSSSRGSWSQIEKLATLMMLAF
jgi:hypothetical protein